VAAEYTDESVEEDVSTTNEPDGEVEEEFDEIFFAPENDFTAEEVVTTDTQTGSDIRLPTPETDLFIAFDIDRFVLEKASEFQHRQTPNQATTDRNGRRKYLTDVESGQLSDNAVDMEGPGEDEGHLAYYHKQAGDKDTDTPQEVRHFHNIGKEQPILPVPPEPDVRES
jgi:hypothetical protein